MINEFNSLSSTRAEKRLVKADPRWEEVLNQLDISSTKLLFKQQVSSVEFYTYTGRYEVTVKGDWLGMVKSRGALLQRAVSTVHGILPKVHFTSEREQTPNPLSEFSDAALLAEIQRRLEVK